jgi:hypothetical protein
MEAKAISWVKKYNYPSGMKLKKVTSEMSYGEKSESQAKYEMK